MSKIVKLPNGDTISFPDNIPTEEMDRAIENHLASRETAPSAESLPPSPIQDRSFRPSLLLKAAGTEALNLPSDILGGIAKLTPGVSPIDPTLERWSKNLEAQPSPETQMLLAQAGSGELGQANKWASMVGTQVPNLVLYALLARLGMKGGGSLGRAVSGSAAGVRTAAAAAEGAASAAKAIGGVAGSVAITAPVVATRDAGYFNRVMKTLPLDDDVVEDMAKSYAKSSFIFDTIRQTAFALPYMRGSLIPQIQKFTQDIPPTARSVFGRNAIKLIGGEYIASRVGGASMAYMANVFNDHLQEAVQLQNKRNLESGKPPIPPEQVAELRMNAEQAFKDGVGLSLLMRSPSAVAKGVKTGLETKQAYNANKQKSALEERVVQAIRDGKSISEILTSEKQTVMQGPGESIEAHGMPLYRAMQEVKQSPEEAVARVGTLNMEQLTELATQYKHPNPVGMGEGDLRSYILSHIGDKQDGSYLSGDTPVIRKPVLNPVDDIQKNRWKVLTGALRKTTKAEAELKTKAGTFQPVDDPVFKYYTTKFQALKDVVGEKLASAMLPREEIIRDNLPETLTNDQMARYNNKMESSLRDMARSVDGKKSIFGMPFQSLVDSSYHVGNIMLDRKGRYLGLKDMPEVPTPVIPPIRSRLTPMWQVIGDTFEKAFGLPFRSMDTALFQAHKMATSARTIMQTVAKKWVGDLPRELREGETGAAFDRLVQWKGTDKFQREAMAKEWKLGEKYGKAHADIGETELMAEIRKAGAKLTDAEIRKQADAMGDNLRLYWDWCAKQGILTPQQFRENYMPVIRIFVGDLDAKREGMGMGDWLKAKGRKNREVQKYLGIGEDFDPDGDKMPLSVRHFIDATDMISFWRRRGYSAAVPGKEDPWFQFQRASDRAYIEDMARITDPQEMIYRYNQKMFNKIFFGDLAPSVFSLIREGMSKIPMTDESSRRLYQNMMETYLSSIMGAPDVDTKMMRDWKVKLPAPMQSLVNVTAHASAAITRIATFGKIKHVPRSEHNWADVLNTLTGSMYSLGLGTLTNPMAPVKNILSQNVMSIASLGFQRYVQGLYLFMRAINKGPGDPWYDRLMKYNLRPEHTVFGVDVNLPAGIRKMNEMHTRLFSMSDSINLLTAASGAMVAWEKLKPLLKDDPRGLKLTTADLASILVRGDRYQKFKNITDQEIISKHPVKMDKQFNGVIDRSVLDTMLDLIQKGRVDQAEDLWVQWNANFSQWRYTAGGGIYWLQSPLKMFTMYSSWPLNYVKYFGDTFGRGARDFVQGHGGLLLGRSLMTMGAQFGTVALLHAMAPNTKVWNLVLAGPFPQNFGFSGPVTQSVQTLWDAIHKGSDALTADLLGDEDESDKAMKQAERKLAELWGSSLNPLETIPKRWFPEEE